MPLPIAAESPPPHRQMTYKIAIFLGVLSHIGVAAAAPASPSEPAPTADPRFVASLADYRPRAAQFGPQLREPAALIEEGYRLSDARDRQQAELRLHAALTALDGGKIKLPRGKEEQVPLLRALAFEGLGDQKAAIKQYEATLKLQPTNILAHFRRGLILSRTNQCATAIQEFHEVEWYLTAIRYETSYLVGLCLKASAKPGDKDQAEKLFEQSIQLNPGYLPALREVIAYKLHVFQTTPEPDKQKALATSMEAGLNAILLKDPGDRESALALSRLLLRGPAAGDRKARVELAIQRMQKLADESQFKDDTAVRLLVQGLTMKGDVAGAEAALSRGLLANPGSAELKAAQQQLVIDKSTSPSPSPAPAAAAGAVPVPGPTSKGEH